MATARLFLVLFCLPFFVSGQSQESFDIATFTPPVGWKREAIDFAASYVITNNNTGNWCRVAIYKSIGSSGDARVDFESEWKNIAEKDCKGISTPNPETITEDGWTATSSPGQYKWQEKDAYYLLTSISGYGKVVTITANMNSDAYLKDVEKFMSSIDLIKPKDYVAENPKNTSTPVTTGNNTNTSQATIPVIEMGKAGNHGISISTTNFDDGWVAQPFADYVRVSKGQVTVLLHYAIKITDQIRDSNDVPAYLFDMLMQPRYIVSNIRKYDNGGPCYFCIYFYEADVTEKSTNKKYHAGFRVLIESGIARCVEILSPSAQDFQKEFPNQEKIAAMTGYNKFAVSQADLIGEWDESSGAYVNMYSTVTGAYAGMNSSSSANKFIFKPDGTYFSNHKGAFGMVGSMQFYDQKYNGNYTVTNWDITATKRFEGKTDVWWAQFEAVREGCVLHLQDKVATGMQYHLVKAK
ncbi:MAG: hypothetical protein MUF39_06180 [Cyclobacteriaceae bacterium]|nr:hypothetical protein [Cyclobacteriaceae bacterium]